MRQVARHVYIKELLDGEYEEREGWEPNVLHTARGDCSRVNIIGAVLAVAGQKVLDDGTGQLTLRSFEPVPGLDSAQSGDVVQVVGRPREYSGERYLIPEVVRGVDPQWAAVRKGELGAVQGFTRVEKRAPEPEPAPDAEVENKADLVVSVIGGLDTGDGAGVDEVIAQSGLGDEAEAIINQLLLDGEIFEIRPGVVKVL